ncbi:MAG: aldo/keto reductase [Lachnospiraceae bacterium]|nr:aldo/keto reductase [Lachnospiraceae bacterium]
MVTKRHFDNLGIDASLLGFGCMRLPQKDGRIDEARAEAMIDRAYAAGVNYFDTAYPYHDGKSEPFVGKALDKYDRSSYFLATKLPLWKINSLEDAKSTFNEQLERLHKDYIDFYLFHAFNRGHFERMKEYGVFDYLESEKAAGRIRYLGFSFHDSFDAFKEIIEYRKWDFCQIQYNYMDTGEQAGDKGVALAESLGVPLIIMEPVKGGSLATLPDEVTEGFRKARPESSAASWALRFVASRKAVKVVLSGMTTEEQLEDNLATFTDFEPLSEDEEKLVRDTAEAIRKRTFIGCTGCRYCMPCPSGVNIPRNFSLWNEYGMYNNAGSTKWHWNNLPDAEKGSSCVECGACEEACPQHLNIRESLKAVVKTMEGLG